MKGRNKNKMKKKIGKKVKKSKSRKQTGKGLINKLINTLPFELHAPGYQYLGPGTKLEKRLKRNDSGINELDKAAKEHDIAYSKTNKTSERHVADKILQKRHGIVCFQMMLVLMNELGHLVWPV